METDFPEASFTPHRMCPTTRFELIAVKSNCPEESIKGEASHTFNSRTSDWGFAQFLSQQEVLNSHNEYLMNDTLTLRANIKVEDNDLGMVSKLNTGFVGIKSPRSESLLTSFLQCLFHVNAFRKAVYEMQTLKSDDPRKSLPLALQQLFYKLQYQSITAKTKDLFRALNWNCMDFCLQHDVPETQHLLFHKLDEGDKADSMKECISELFMGEYSNYIKSPSIEEAQTFRQSFTEISLNVLEGKDIYTSLEKFCKNDTLEEHNHVQKKSHKAGKSTQGFQINSYFEFYDELDLDYKDHVLMSKNADRSIENKYKLHSVVVHADDSARGRYCAFVRHDENWFKFDGELVTAVSAEEAINEQFGDQDGTANANFSNRFESINKSAAVMLLYIRKSEWQKIMCDADEKYLSKELRECFDKERMVKEKQHKEKKEAHLYVIINLTTDSDFARQVEERYCMDLVDFDTIKNYRILKKTSFEDFKEMISKDFGIPKNLQRFWRWSSEKSNNVKVFGPVNDRSPLLETVWDLRHFLSFDNYLAQEETALMTFKLFLESPKKSYVTEDTLHPIQENELLVFLKFYNPELRKFSYLGHMFIEKTSEFYLVFEKAKETAGLALEEEVVGFRRGRYVPSVDCADLAPDTTPESIGLLQGDIIIIQKVVAENSQCEYPTAKSFLQFLQLTMIINFRPLEKPDDEGFRLNLMANMAYEQVTVELAKHLQVDDPKKVRLTRCMVYYDEPHWRPIEYNGIDYLEQIGMYGSQRTYILYYEVLDIQLPYLETLNCIKVPFLNAKGTTQSEHHLRLSRESKVSDLVKALKLQLGEEYNDCDIRVKQLHYSKVSILSDQERIVKQLMPDYPKYAAEVIPEDQKNLNSDEFLVLFCQCELDDGNVKKIGSSLLVKVRKSERVRQVKVRIQKTLEISNEDFSQWQCVYHVHPMHPLEYLSDEDEILAKFPNSWMTGTVNGKIVGDNTSFIALVHEDIELNH